MFVFFSYSICLKFCISGRMSLDGLVFFSLSLSCGFMHTFSPSVALIRILHQRHRCIAVLIVQVLSEELLGRIPGHIFTLHCYIGGIPYEVYEQLLQDKCSLSLSVGCSNIWCWRGFCNDDDFIHRSCRGLFAILTQNGRKIVLAYHLFLSIYLFTVSIWYIFSPVVNWCLHWCFKICKCNYDSSINY